MTYKECISRLEGLIENSRPLDGKAEKRREQDIEALEMAIKAVNARCTMEEKNLPKIRLAEIYDLCNNTINMARLICGMEERENNNPYR